MGEVNDYRSSSSYYPLVHTHLGEYYLPILHETCYILRILLSFG